MPPQEPAADPSSNGSGDVPEHSSADAPAPRRPVGVSVAAAVVALEALALAGVAVWYIVGLLTQTPLSMGGAIFMVVLLAALAAGLAAVSLNLFRGYRWTRSAAFVWQLLMLSIAVPTLFGGQPLLGILFLVPPLVVAVLLFTPRVVAYTLRTGGDHPVL
ncbi:hypothetical protein [Specibacter cremeus]|uniref:hypothetical protein n=1 Tax=Specibacter cremeus TaxID=1629051 RepID=UPI001F0B9D9C|nr:hypothetical protein [Specibacter cremeus]